MSFIPFIVLWALLALTVLALFVWRKTVDKWGKIVTVVTVVYGLIIGALYVYQSWMQNK